MCRNGASITRSGVGGAELGLTISGTHVAANRFDKTVIRPKRILARRHSATFWAATTSLFRTNFPTTLLRAPAELAPPSVPSERLKFQPECPVRLHAALHRRRVEDITFNVNIFGNYSGAPLVPSPQGETGA